MTPPPFLLGSVLLFWGWQSQLITLAVPMATILEGRQWVNWRWIFADKDFNRVTDLTSISAILVVFYLFNQYSIHGLTLLLKSLPILFFLLLVAQLYSTQGSIRLSSLFLSLRHHEAKGNIPPSSRIDLSYPYMMICLLSASVNYANGFFLGISMLSVWALWSIRSPRYNLLLWLTLITLTLATAYVAQRTLTAMQNQVEELIFAWFQERFLSHRDPYRQYTALGDIGKLKLSDQIILRVTTPYPIKLREASYNVYFKNIWRTATSNFQIQRVKNEIATWQTVPPLPNLPKSANHLIASQVPSATKPPAFTDVNSLHIATYPHDGKAVLALPHGTHQLIGLPLTQLQYNSFGAVKVEQAPGLLEYTARFGQQTPLDLPPTHHDLHLPPNETQHLTALAKQLNLLQQTPPQVLATLIKFFQYPFQYTLHLTAPPSKDTTPLEYFLQTSHRGHCEYFATATVLLLRAAGIPSRYAAGYAVEEFSPLERVYIVRKRHAHAWTLAYLGGRWLELDTTPANWLELDADLATWWQPVYDLSSWLAYQLAKWRWRKAENGSNNWLLWLIIPLSLMLIWRLYSREKVARERQSIAASSASGLIGADSPFYQIIQQLTVVGFVRQPGETLSTWLNRIHATHWVPVDLLAIFKLHQRYRFDPHGISAQEYAFLTSQVEQWLYQFQQKQI